MYVSTTRETERESKYRVLNNLLEVDIEKVWDLTYLAASSSSSSSVSSSRPSAANS